MLLSQSALIGQYCRSKIRYLILYHDDCLSDDIAPCSSARDEIMHGISHNNINFHSQATQTIQDHNQLIHIMQCQLE